MSKSLTTLWGVIPETRAVLRESRSIYLPVPYAPPRPVSRHTGAHMSLFVNSGQITTEC